MTSSIISLLQSLHIIPRSTISESVPPPTAVQNISKSRKSKSIPKISLQTVSQHDDFRDCWIVIYDRVYDVTKFLAEHPGGADIIMDYAGRDGTLAFHDTGHSSDAIKLMQNYIIGELPPHECIFRTANKRVLSKGIPE